MNILIIGGVGFLGRHLSLTIEKQKLAKHLCIVDKRVPEMVHLSNEMMTVIAPNFQQADMSNPSTATRIFGLHKWDWVFNLQSELPFDANEYFFETEIYNRSLIVGTKAAECGVRCLVQCSGTEVYKGSSGLQNEDAPLKPSTRKGKWILKTEQGLQAIHGYFMLKWQGILIQ
ncbi:hypothetical protein NEOLI_005361 [Neolecta irregularis DAH-3]|uniref:NAD-dependent epimerase/dehydratase domain-containing protein n=1 Tax=Neolecta irregularis (strain DAH-3) TaxID=1198029 RepID=A0A1U7LRZ6_NEOID|nr:hypothetical protein NEOLI_005361 [Neolecta irregularis DAH-3]|eukprot:OLL25291.1 hypothetical protein NEOLI_005361 [Neolecta irregularis DAH-3]